MERNGVVAWEVCNRLGLIRIECATIERMLRELGADKAALRVISDLIDGTNSLEALLVAGDAA